MSSIHSPEPKNRPKLSMLSPIKTKELFKTPTFGQIQKEKRISYISTENQPRQRQINTNPNQDQASLDVGEFQKRQSHQNQEYKVNQQMKIGFDSKDKNQSVTIQRFQNFEKFKDFQQPNHDSNSRNLHPEDHLDKDYFKNKILHFESLRSTLTNNQNSSQNLQPKIVRKNFENSDFSETKKSVSNKIFQKKLSSQLNPAGIQNMIQLSVDSPYQNKTNQSKQQRNQNFYHLLSSKKISHLNELKENTQPSFFQAKQDLNTKRERKFPSFLSTKDQNKEIERREEKNYFRPFKRFTPLNSDQEKQNHEPKTPLMKKLLNVRHVKSYSVFENLTYGNKKKQFEDRRPLIASNFPQTRHSQLRKKTPDNRQKSNSIQYNKTIFVDTLQSDCGNPNKVKKDLSFFRKSLNQSPHEFKRSSEKFSIKKQEVVNTFIHPHEKEKFDNSCSKKEENIIFQKIENGRISKGHSKQAEIAQIKFSKKNFQAIDDIKQTLINCNLFSEEDCKGVLENHKKDILKTTNKNSIKTVQFQIQNCRPKPSIKELIDTSSQSDDSPHNSEQQKRIAQLASLCQQKRSKWMLQQIDIIKESLKQLSEFNTQKSLFENEWKKVSIKDFNTSRKNRCSVQFENIDQVKEEESISESRDFKLSSVRLVSHSIFQEDSKENEEKVFRKSKSYELQSTKTQFWNVSLQDFDVRWSFEEKNHYGNSNTQSNFSYVAYTAQHKATKTLYLIKKYEKSHFQKLGQLFMSNFIKHVKIQMFLLDHPNIEKIYSIFSDKTSIYLLCEFTSTKLSSILIQSEHSNILNSSQQSISLNTLSSEFEKIELFGEIVDGLEEVHINHIVHKNFQPNSIRIICQTCKISNFESCEISKNSLDRRVSHTYVCPENLFDSKLTSMDIWCLGILAYELLIGKKPFHNEKASSNNTVKKILECNFDIPSSKAQLCEEILNMALKRNPKDRASVFDIKNVWEKKLSKFNTLIVQNQKIRKKLQEILNR